mmetsp:Transcript_38383/g.62381  ORF Transcript_38383/g.62381 Transcript_38383/m.62381 type:complete len:661 (+) Transcript_38383:90-2072(+)
MIHLAARPSLKKVRRSASLFWFEKIQVTIKFLQFYALLWVIANRWPWPAQWQADTSFSLLSCLDLYSWCKKFGLELSNGAFTMFMVFIPCVALIIFSVLRFTLYSSDNINRNKQCISLWTMKRVFGYASEIYFIPFLLHALRVWPNECTDGKMTYMREIECNGIVHLGMSGITILLFLLYVLAVPYYFFSKSRSLEVFAEPDLHENSLQSREIEYVLELSDLYEQTHVWVIAPFRRNWMYTKCRDFFLKFYLTSAAVQGFRTDETTQILMYFIGVSIEPVIKIISLQYRCNSTNVLVGAYEWCLVILSLFGVLSHNSERNSLFIDSTLTMILRAISLLCAVVVTILVLACLCGGWSYTVSKKKTETVIEKDKYFIEQLHSAHYILRSSTFTPPEFVDRDQLRKQILQLHELREKPETKGHILEWSLQDTIKSLILLYENSENLTLLPNPKLVDALDGFSERLIDLETERVVVHPDLQDFYSRLLVVRYLLPDDYMNGDRAAWEEETEEMQDTWLENLKITRVKSFDFKSSGLVTTRNRTKSGANFGFGNLFRNAGQFFDGLSSSRPGSSAGSARGRRVHRDSVTVKEAPARMRTVSRMGHRRGRSSVSFALSPHSDLKSLKSQNSIDLGPAKKDTGSYDEKKGLLDEVSETGEDYNSELG